MCSVIIAVSSLFFFFSLSHSHHRFPSLRLFCNRVSLCISIIYVFVLFPRVGWRLLFPSPYLAAPTPLDSAALGAVGC